jgi:hypothetical protein
MVKLLKCGDYSNMSGQELHDHASSFSDRDALCQDLLPDDYKQRGFKDNFRDKYRENMQALGEAERGAAKSGRPGGRDIGKQERGAKEPAWKTNLEAKRSAAQTAASNKKSGFLARNKNKVIAAVTGIIITGGMSIFMLPGIAIAEFGQFANWIKNTTQTVHELATGARTMRNTVRSATVAARAAASAAAKTHFQTARTGMFGQMVGDNFLNKLRSAGVDIKASGVLGTWETMEIDVEKTSGSKAFKNMSPEMQKAYVQKKYPDLDTDKIKEFDGGKIQFEGKTKAPRHSPERQRHTAGL